MSLSENLINRKWLALRVRAEIVGPDPTGNEQHINLYGEPIKYSWENFRKPRKQINGEEIIWQDPPSKRYGAGILYPLGILDEAETNKLEEEKQEVPDIDPDGLQDVDEKLEKMAEKKATKIRIAMDDSEDYAVTLSNAFKPSAIGLSFLADLALEDKGFRVEVVNVSCLGHDELQEIPAGTYKPVKAEVGNLDGKQYERTQWLRVPLLDNEGKYPHIDVSSRELLASKGPIKRKLNTTTMSGLEIVVVHRGGYSRMTSSQRLITVSLVNRTHPDAGSIDAHCLFQVGIRVKGISNSKWIHPYPETEIGRLKDRDPLADEYINLLLYRQHKTFAIGHGCAADWPGSAPEMVSEVWSDILPTFETPSTSADLFIIGEDGNKKPIKVSMQKLAGLDPDDDGQQEIEDLLKAYEGWILSLKKERVGVPAVPEELQKTANGLVERCENCLKRMRDGVAFLKEDSEIARSACHAFRLANYAMLIAQMRATTNVRKPSLTKDGHIVWTPAILERDPAIRDSKLGYWRAFQIAFLLMSLRAIAEPDCTERDIVDLIWFPTGGGKTEAYLGLTVYTVFFNRLSNRNPGGTDVLMRYTLRLLTAQQFQRAALLFCAMEHLRRKDKRLGEKPFRIGLWVGGSASPNTRIEALGALEKLEKDPESENPFVLLKCPWCGAKFGPSSSGEEGRKRRGQGGHIQKTGIPSVLGYHRYTKTNRHPTTVVFRCNDGACEFGTASAFQKPSPPLPIVIIDDDLLDDPPNLVIGTVDKFAMLAWKPEVRRLFGISDNGQHDGLPPSLIIQDELHMISGPLGSMVGAYETVIERLCRERGIGETKPKIIASTATISYAREQIKHLYARDKVFLFPPSGLEAGDSFFAREALNDDGSLQPGRLYLGVLAPAHGSLQTTEARVFASLMQHTAIMNTDDAGRDPWWTLICFFNSLRELGSAASLFVADTREYLRVIIDRQGLKYDSIRKLFEVSELTSRIRSDLVPKELERLEKIYLSRENKGENSEGFGDTVDACLASNIIEVGVDVSRLALMVIVGQPKTTSQYIQVSSRIGRDAEKPGLVVILYGQSKPRDRSHYERFRPYHQQLYAQVEPTSVTPFSPPAVDRALHAIIVAAVRQFGKLATESSKPDPFPLGEGTSLRNLVEKMIIDRVSVVAPDEQEAVVKKFLRHLDEWRTWSPAEYGSFGTVPKDPPLIHPAGNTQPPSWDGRSWPTMSSLRDVDASCEATVTSYFNQLWEEHT